MSSLKLVTFDVTNTIIKVSGSVGLHYANVGKLYGVEADEQQLNKAFKLKWKEQTDQYPNYGVAKGMSSFSWWTDLVKKCFIHAGHTDDDKLNQVSSHLYIHFKTAKAWEVLPGAVHILQAIKDKGLSLGVISNFDERLDKILMTLALRHYFDFVLASQEVKLAKPDREIFERAMIVGKVDADSILHIGDNEQNDYWGARNAGCHSLLLAKNKSEVKNGVDKNHVISNLEEILNHL